MLGLCWGREILRWRNGGMNVDFLVWLGLMVVLKEIVEEDLQWHEAAKEGQGKGKEEMGTK